MEALQIFLTIIGVLVFIIKLISRNSGSNNDSYSPSGAPALSKARSSSKYAYAFVNELDVPFKSTETENINLEIFAQNIVNNRLNKHFYILDAYYFDSYVLVLVQVQYTDLNVSLNGNTSEVLKSYNEHFLLHSEPGQNKLTVYGRMFDDLTHKLHYQEIAALLLDAASNQNSYNINQSGSNPTYNLNIN